MSLTLNIFFLALMVLTANVVNAFEVNNGRQGGYSVTADDYVYVTTPTNKKIQVTNIPFVGDENGYHYSIPPTEPILCTWDPTHRWLAIFITKKQITEIDIFDLRTNTVIQVDTTVPKYPKWMDRDQVFTHSKPVQWSENTLLVNCLVRFKEGDERNLRETIIIKDNEFEVVPYLK